MKRLTNQQLMYVGGLEREGNCGNSTESAVVEFTCGVAGALIGWGLSGGNPIGAVYGAKVGYSACKIGCHA